MSSLTGKPSYRIPYDGSGLMERLHERRAEYPVDPERLRRKPVTDFPGALFISHHANISLPHIELQLGRGAEEEVAADMIAVSAYGAEQDDILRIVKMI